MESEQKKSLKYSWITVTIVGIIIVIAAIFILNHKVATAPSIPDIATTTENVSVKNTGNIATTTQSNNLVDPFGNWKVYTNNNLGVSFRYPMEFILKGEKFDAEGNYSALLKGNAGDEIVLTLHKGVTVTLNEPKLQSSSVTVGGKVGVLFNTRVDTCDVANSEVQYDKAYNLELTFKSCGNGQNLFADKVAIKKILNSVSFQNTNTVLVIDTKLNVSFRYPITEKLVESNSQSLGGISYTYSIGDYIKVVLGPIYGTTKGMNLTLEEAVALRSPTTQEKLNISGHDAVKITIAGANGVTQRKLIVTNTTSKDLIEVTSTALDTSGYETVIKSLVLIK